MSFFALLPPTNPKNQDFNKWKNLLEISSFYTCVSKITIIWCMVPEIWSVTDRMFCHYRLFFALLARYGPRESKFWKNKKKAVEDITINDSHIIYVFSVIDCNRQNFCHFGPFFSLLTLLPLTTWNQNFGNLKKAPGAIIIFTQVYQK